MAVSSADWLDLMRREYLRKFVPGGGSAIKFLMAGESELTDVRAQLDAFAQETALHRVAVDAVATKIHMIQDIFFAISRSVDWDRLAQTWVEDVFRRNRYVWPHSGESVALRAIADANDVSEVLLRREIQQWLARDIMRDSELAQDFRSAMANLCLRRMEMGDERAVAPVIDWLRGELRTISSVRQVPISAKITRHNGGTMLRSLCHWLRLCGVDGIVLSLDIRQLGRGRTGPTDALRFGPAAVMDAYEVLRQLIDGAERFKGLFLVVLADPSFRDGDPKRSVTAYRALKERIWPDVHARGHENPLTPLIQIDEASDQHPAYRAEPLEMPYNEERVAIEALRAGVPNRAAIRQLGSTENAICEEVLGKLARSRENLRGNGTVPGVLVAGSFGTGKSHLLGFLAEQALRQNFVVSVVPVSKETPLFDPQKMFAAAVRNAVAPGSNDDVMTAAISRLDPSSDAFADLEAWVSDERSGLAAIFAALLFLIPKQAILPDDLATIARFFGGSPLGVPRVRQWLKATGASRLFQVGQTKAAELAAQRLRFAPRLFAAAGYAGWCILIDEVELIGRYSTLQRSKSYGELCRWLNLDVAVAIPGIVSVAAITGDFADAVLHQRLDQEKAPEVLRARGLDQQARLAEIAMRFIEKGARHLSPPGGEQLQRSLDTVRRLYAESYGWPAYGGEIGELLASRTMREYIKAWVTAWDIYRLYGARDEIDTETIASDYSENTDLEHAPADEPADGELA
jgi:hypothetical protein